MKGRGGLLGGWGVGHGADPSEMESDSSEIKEASGGCRRDS